VVENIPPTFLEIEQINSYFRRFGTLTNIKLEPAFKRATLTYSQVSEATEALNCPDVIFENRFVKLHLLREEVVMPHPQLAAPPSDPHSTTEVTATSLRRIPIPPNGGGTAGGAEAPSSERKGHPALPAITTTAQLLQVQKSQEALIAKQLAESKRIMERLSSGHLSEADRKMLLVSLKALSGATQQSIQSSQLRLSKATASSPTTPGGLASPATAMDVTPASPARATAAGGEVDPLLQAKLEALQQEAKVLGVRVPGAGGGAPSTARRGGAAYHPYAGGRGSHTWTAGRGSSQAPVLPRTFHLDMRPKQLRIAGPDLPSISADIAAHYQVGAVVCMYVGGRAVLFYGD
jgi:RNA-binding protein 26